MDTYLFYLGTLSFIAQPLALDFCRDEFKNSNTPTPVPVGVRSLVVEVTSKPTVRRTVVRVPTDGADRQKPNVFIII